MIPAPVLPAGWQPAPDLLRERIILLTGAANGIGRALADALAAHGAMLVLLDRDVHGLELAYDEIVAAGHPEPALYPLDLSGAGPDDYAALAATLQREFGRLDGLIHNAAELGALTPIEHVEAELWFRTLQTDLHAPCLLTMACLDLLKASRDASVIFTSDAVGRHGKAYWGAYGVAKAGLENFMQMLADELETNTPVRVNSIDPGPVLTGLRRIAYPGEDCAELNKPADVVKPFLFLASAASRGITGRQLSVAADAGE
ncbi:MAG: SDR family oxidoreductase [Gammaproteobacteria bacterium]|jgi:NAD(P)-dependent dehydrogenase (short-subunit alcohol dehydrogenase family)